MNLLNLNIEYMDVIVVAFHPLAELTALYLILNGIE